MRKKALEVKKIKQEQEETKGCTFVPKINNKINFRKHARSPRPIVQPSLMITEETEPTVCAPTPYKKTVLQVDQQLNGESNSNPF